MNDDNPDERRWRLERSEQVERDRFSFATGFATLIFAASFRSIYKLSLRPSFLHYNMEALRAAREKYQLCPSTTCESFPCNHSPFSTDEDYLIDSKIFVERPEYHSELWLYFHNRESSSPELLRIYGPDLDMCQRITDKRQQIEDETRENMEIIMEEIWGRPRPPKITITKEEREALVKSMDFPIGGNFRKLQRQKEQSSDAGTSSPVSPCFSEGLARSEKPGVSELVQGDIAEIEQV